MGVWSATTRRIDVQLLKIPLESVAAGTYRRQTSVAYDKDVAAAKKRGDHKDKIYDIENVAHHEDTTYAEEIYRLHTGYLWREANRLIIPTPASDDETAWQENWGHRHLTHKGINDLRAAIGRKRNCAGRLF